VMAPAALSPISPPFGPWQPSHGLHAPRLQPKSPTKAQTKLQAKTTQDESSLHATPGRSRPRAPRQPAPRIFAGISGGSCSSSDPPWVKRTRCAHVELANAETAAAEDKWMQDLEVGLRLQLGQVRRPASAGSLRQKTAKDMVLGSKSNRALSTATLATRGSVQAPRATRLSKPRDKERESAADDFYKGVEAHKHEEKARKDHEAFEDELRQRLVDRSAEAVGASQEEEDLMHRAIRMPDLDPRLKIRAALRYAKCLARAGRDASRSETLEFEAELSRDRQLFLQNPSVSFDLSQVCRESLSITSLADSICEQLAEAAVKLPPGPQHPFCFVLVDLSEWRQGRGESVEARRLLELAMAMPEKSRDPRTITRHYAWRFDSEPGVPGANLKNVPMSRPLLGPERHCPCCLGPACKVKHKNDNERRESRRSSRLSSGGNLRGDDIRLDQEVRQELRDRFNIAGSLMNLANLAGETAVSDGAQRMAHAKAAAQRLVYSRRFEVNVIDREDADDGVAYLARQRSTCLRELALREALGEESETATESKSALTSGASSADLDSDQYFRSLEIPEDDEASDVSELAQL